MNKRTILKYGLIVLVLLAGCNSDLYTKKIATEALKNKSSITVVRDYLDLRYSENEGVAFSFMEELNDRIREPILISLPVILLAGLCGFIAHERRKPFLSLLPFILILAGGLGNAVDRIQNGYVVDFIYFHIRDVFRWPIFNVADILVCLGVFMLVLNILFNKDAV